LVISEGGSFNLTKKNGEHHARRFLKELKLFIKKNLAKN